MSTQDPKELLGKRETATLEFKAAEILKTPAKVGREVVGFLNANGGEVWIGVQEKDGMAVPPLQAIPDVDKEKGALWDHLISTIEPLVLQSEVKLIVVPHAGGSLIKIEVAKGARGPYAQIDRGRHFPIRADHRLREMSREEIIDAVRKSPGDESRATEVVKELRRAQKEVTVSSPRVWIRLAPTEPLALDFDDEATWNQFRAWLTNAKTTGNRASGWNFVVRLQEPKHWEEKRGVKIGDEAIPWVTTVSSAGEITFALSSQSLFKFDDDRRDLIIHALLELPVSIFRLAAEIIKRYGTDRPGLQIVTGMTITGMHDARLRPGSASDPLAPWEAPRQLEEDTIEGDPAQLVFSADDVVSNPDRCGLRLVRLIYSAFGFDRDAIPPEFDQKQGVLLLS
jgi:hypothetical protein